MIRFCVKENTCYLRFYYFPKSVILFRGRARRERREGIYSSTNVGDKKKTILMCNMTSLVFLMPKHAKGHSVVRPQYEICSLV